MPMTIVPKTARRLEKNAGRSPPAAARLDAGSGYRVLLYLGLGHSCLVPHPGSRTA